MCFYIQCKCHLPLSSNWPSDNMIVGVLVVLLASVTTTCYNMHEDSICMYVGMCTCMLEYMYVCMYVCMHICIWAVNECMSVCICICIHVGWYAWVYVYACMCACMSLCIYACMYVDPSMYVWGQYLHEYTCVYVCRGESGDLFNSTVFGYTEWSEPTT